MERNETKAVRVCAGVCLACVLSTVSEAHGALRLGAPFADGAVLQRDRTVPVWGWAEPGRKVVVSFADQTVSATAGEDGAWRVGLAPMAASREGRVLTVSERREGLFLDSETDVRNVSDVLVGEVWYVSGQSNAECPLWNNAKDGNNPRFRDANGALVAQMTYRPYVRMCYASNYRTSDSPRAEPRFEVKWEPFSPASLGLGAGHGFSAIGVYYALELYAALELPIGIVGSYWGGTRIEPWIPAEGFEAVGMPAGGDERARLNPRTKEPRPAPQQPSRLWNEMVNPFAPMAMRGLIWYQGCSNGGDTTERYVTLMHAFYRGWSRRFENDALRFYYVQLAPRGDGGQHAVQLAQAIFAGQEPNAAMAVINDLGNLSDIHPNRKEGVARRLAVHALRRDYGFDAIEDDSPVLRSHCVRDGRFVLTFDHAKSFYIYNEKYCSQENGFEICGADGVWKPGILHNFIRHKKDGSFRGGLDGGNVLEVSAEGVAEPRKLRYLHSRPWKGVLYNEVCLPLGIFYVDASEGSVPADGR